MKLENIKSVETKLWNKNFFLLWQGQLVSVLGDVLYIIALDFWILDMTGSTALMGILSALTMAPRIILGPFAGVFIDKWDRKKVIVITDLIRGIFVSFIGIAGVFGFIKVWMIFIVGIVSGICSAFFNPAIMSSRPDIVPEDKLMKANSATSLAQSGMDMVGNAIGGVLYVLIGAPYMFLFNGVSYLFSAFSELFIYIPKIERKNNEITFKEDFKIGFKFIKEFKVFRNVFLYASLINFFGNAGMILLVPYFREMPFLGVEKYGFAMMTLSLGMMSSSILLSIKSIQTKNKCVIFKTTMLGFCLLLIIAVITNNYTVLLFCFGLGFFFNVCFNTIFSTMLMSIIPSNIRGKVMSITSTLSMGLVPIGQCIGGILGEFLPIRSVLIILFTSCFIVCILCCKIKNIKKLIEYDSSTDSLEQLMSL